eukprot:7121183-Prymnesium_polylepis.1
MGVPLRFVYNPLPRPKESHTRTTYRSKALPGEWPMADGGARGRCRAIRRVAKTCLYCYGAIGEARS